MKAGIAILIAFILTGFAGFLTTVSPVDVVKTSYDRVADLTPSVISNDVNSYEEYYPSGNVVGWSGDIIFPESNKASAYRYSTIVSTTEESAFTYLSMVNQTYAGTPNNPGTALPNYRTWNVWGYANNLYVDLDDGKVVKGQNFDEDTGRTYNGGYDIRDYYTQSVVGGTFRADVKIDHVITIDGVQMDDTATVAYYYMPISSFLSSSFDTRYGAETVLTTLKDSTTISFNGESGLTSTFFTLDDSAWNSHRYTEYPDVSHNDVTVTMDFKKIGEGDEIVQYLTYVKDSKLWYPTKFIDGVISYKPNLEYAGLSSDEVYIVVSESKDKGIGAGWLSSTDSDQSSVSNPYVGVNCSLTVAEHFTPILRPIYVQVGATISISDADYFCSVQSGGVRGLSINEHKVVGIAKEEGWVNIKFSENEDGTGTTKIIPIYVIDVDGISQYKLNGFAISSETLNYEYHYADPTKFVVVGNRLDGSTDSSSSSSDPYLTVKCSPNVARSQSPLYVSVGASVSIIGNGYVAEISSGEEDIGLASTTGGVAGEITDTGDIIVHFTTGSSSFDVRIVAINYTSEDVGVWSNASSDTEYKNGLVSFLTEPGTTIFTDEAYWSSTSGEDTQGNFTVTVPANIPYDLVLVTLDFVNQSFYAQGVTPLKGLAVEDTVNYTLADYRYPISIPIEDTKPLRNLITEVDSSESDPYTSVVCVPAILEEETIYVKVGAEVAIRGAYVTACSKSGDDIGLIVKEGAIGDSSTLMLGLFGRVTNTGTMSVTFTYGGSEHTTTIIAVGGIVALSYVKELSFEKEGGTKVFIKETWVQLDPMGLLWGDPHLYTYYFYPDLFTTSGSDIIPSNGNGLRILFNGFVAYGNSLTINGVEITVQDKQKGIFTVDDVEHTIFLKGMAVDFKDGHVYLVDTEHKGATYDLGVYNQTTQSVIRNGVATGNYDRVAYTIIGEGAWYWYANIYSIVVTETTEMQIDLSKGLAGWEMSLQVTVLLFIGMLILSVAGVVYMFRDTEPFSFLDWFIIGMAIVILFSVMSL